jgi:ribosomal protein L11 methyltransferase
MSWLEIHATTSANHAHLLGDQFTVMGALSVSFLDAGDQPIYEPTAETPLWEKTIVVGLFDPHHPIQDVLIFLEKQEAEGNVEHFHLKHLEDQDWQRICLESFKPILFGKKCWICPSWHTPPDKNAVNVTLDPGLAFGTGTHPTTALCLEWLDAHITGHEQLVVDFGCGSGILGIAALKLGAKRVLAVDNDPQALIATRANAERNQITQNQLEVTLPGIKIAPQADILIANILAQPLIELAPLFAKWVKPNGKVVLSGILIDQTINIIKAFQPYFHLQNPLAKAEWILLEGDRQIELFP